VQQGSPETTSDAKTGARAGRPGLNLADGVGSPATRRTELNLLGAVDTAAGESRRNENVSFNLVDNNLLKELNARLGTTATIVSEFRPDQNYFGAEFGNAPSVPVHETFRSATGIHGNVYATHLNSVFSARSFFQVGTVKPAHENDYGFSLGVPAWRGADVFVQGSQQKLRGNVNGNVLVPRPDERTPLATDADVRRLVTRFLAAYPAELPNRTDINERALNTNSPQSIDNNYWHSRLDQELGSKDRLSLAYSFTSQSVDAFQLVAGQNPDTDTKSHTARITWTRAWNASTVTEGSLGYDRVGSLLLPEENAVGTFVLTGGALQALGPEGIIPIDRAQNFYRGGLRFSAQRGSHSVITGFEAGRRQVNGIETDVHRGFFSFGTNFGRDAITNLRLGTPTQFIGSIGDPYRAFRHWEPQFYAGDKWQAWPDFSLSFSLRYQPVPRPTEVESRSVVPYDCDCNNFAPQFGFAWRLPRNAGVLRGAYGLHYGEIFFVTYQQIRFFSPPRNYKIVVPNPDLSDPLGGAALTNPRPTKYVLDEELATPYSHQYNLSWEKELARGLNVQVGYVGSRSHKLLLMWYLNRARVVPGIPQTTATVNLRRPDPNFADIRLVINGSRGYFDAGRVSLILNRWRGLSVDAAYWLSKAIDLGSGYSNTAYDKDSRDSRSQSEFEGHSDMKGLSSFDQPHAFLLRAAYAFPDGASWPGWTRHVLAGWTLSAVGLAKSGTPFFVKSGSDAPGYGSVDGNGSTRPILLDPSILGRSVGHPDTSTLLLPRSAFMFIQPTDRAGNLGRNVFRKGGIHNVNASLARSWALAADKRLTFRAESINFFNTPQFAEPGPELVNPNFGAITNTLNDGRTFRFGLELSF